VGHIIRRGGMVEWSPLRGLSSERLATRGSSQPEPCKRIPVVYRDTLHRVRARVIWFTSIQRGGGVGKG